ncbi:MBL fold metallo-hydrolase [Bacillus mycoides]|uniref:MBL fold metallo-hydrolase n=1 Tax=Bacillus mycoides TaxID=1405 RepID=UPI0011EBF767|nr:MBL fold metallo-hydrolase [Bacillus mycoides]QEL85893.1 MBL fold metallo-hydrolase [Bacillus mycoides]
MHKIKIDMFEAGNGDSFLVKCIGNNLTNILIDFGYSNTYKKYVEKSLRKMAEQGEQLDLVIVTHIDQDHISGGIRFFEDNGPADIPQVIGVKEVWHNSYRHLEMAETTKELTEKEKEHISSRSIAIEQNRDGGPTDTSGKQGSRLAANLRCHQYNWNTHFNNRPVSYKKEPIQLNEEVKITVLSPTFNELEKLKKVWKKELKKKFPTIELNSDAIFDDAVECISLMKRPRQIQNLIKNTSTTNKLESLANFPFQEDVDEINASSITCIVEFDGKKLLFLGDTLPSIVETQLRKLFDENEFPIYFDAIKVAHHGSAKNTCKKLLEIIDSEHYFISTNGKIHGHPDTETIAKIVVRETGGFIRNLYFTNQLKKLEIFNDEGLQKTYQYKMHYRNLSQDSIQINL